MKTKITTIMIAILSVTAVAVTVVSGLMGKERLPAADVPDASSSEQSFSSIVSNNSLSVVSDIVNQDVVLHPNVDALFEPTNDDAILSDDDALTVTFDGMIIKPGKTAGAILGEWASVRENDVLKPGESGYMTLVNSRWTNKDNRLNNETLAKNGEIILWVHNYAGTAQRMRNCVIYKYKINYRGCKDIFAEQPSLQYLDKYTLGYADVFPTSEYETVNDEIGVYTRHFYGSADKRQVILDSSRDEGLFAITVTYNLFYGPSFEGGEQ